MKTILIIVAIYLVIAAISLIVEFISNYFDNRNHLKTRLISLYEQLKSHNEKNVAQLEKEYYKMMGGQISYEGNIPNLRRIDKLLVSTLNESCQSVSRKLNGFIIGTENQIDMISYMYSLSPKDITKFIIANARLLTGTMNIYKEDLIHKLILKVSGVESLSRVQLNIVPDSDVIFERMVESYPSLVTQLNISIEVIREIIKNIHVKCFNNKPILKL